MTNHKHPLLRRRALGAFAFATLLGASSFASAEEGAAADHGEAAQAEGHGAGPAVHWNEIGAAIVNFGIYAALIGAFASKPIGAFYAERRAKLEQSIEASRKAQAEAAASLAAAEARLAGLAGEQKSIIEEADRHAQTEAARIVSEAREQAVKIKADAAMLGEHEARAAKNRFRVKLANQALAYAQDEISRALTTDVQARLIDAGIERVTRQPTAAQPTV